MDESPFDLPTDPPPSSPPVHRDPGAVAPGMLFTVGNAFGEGGRAFTKCYAPLLGVGVVWTLIAVAASLPGMVVPCADTVLSVLFVWPLYPGLAYVGITAVRDRRVRFEDMFIGYRYYGRSLLLVLLVALAVFATVIPALVVGVVIATVMGGMSGSGAIVIAAIAVVLLAFLPIAYVTCRLGLAYGLSVDPVAGPLPAMEAISRSWEYTRDVAWTMVGLYFLVILMIMGSTLLLIVGYWLLGIPLAFAISGATYCLIVGNRVGRSCPHCGYSFEGLTSVACPECGAPV